jgi:hypothetical protein
MSDTKPIKIDIETTNNILNLLVAYWKPSGGDGKLSGWLDISIMLDDMKERHPREYAVAERWYRQQYAPRKERSNFNKGVFHAEK